MPSQDTKIDKTTLVPLAMVASIVLATVYGTRWVTTAETQMQEQAEALGEQSNAIKNLADAVERNTELFTTATNDRWRRADEVRQWERFAADNPDLRVYVPR